MPITVSSTTAMKVPEVESLPRLILTGRGAAPQGVSGRCRYDGLASLSRSSPRMRESSDFMAMSARSAWFPAYAGRSGRRPKLDRICSDIEHTPIGVEHRFLHHLRERRMREDGVHKLLLRRLKVHRNHVALDQLGDLRTHHVRADERTGFLVE